MVSLSNPRQERFCLEYFITGNGTQSAIKAGYSPKTAVVIASRMLRFVNISDRLRELQTEATNSKTMEINERLGILSNIARSANAKLASPIEAIKEYNRMTGAYPPQQRIPPNVVFRVEFVKKKELQELEGTPVIEGESRELPEGG